MLIFLKKGLIEPRHDTSSEIIDGIDCLDSNVSTKSKSQELRGQLMQENVDSEKPNDSKEVPNAEKGSPTDTAGLTSDQESVDSFFG
jgi:hypothetical protein